MRDGTSLNSGGGGTTQKSNVTRHMLHTRIRQLPGSGRAVTTGYPAKLSTRPTSTAEPSHVVLYLFYLGYFNWLWHPVVFLVISSTAILYRYQKIEGIRANALTSYDFCRGIAISSIISKVIYVVANPSEEEIAVNYPVHTWTENASSNSCEISRVDRCVFGFSSWLSTMSSAFSMTNHFSTSEHQWTCDGYYQQCAQSLYALKVLRCYGMGDDALMIIFRSVVLAKILYASPAWWGFANSSDKQRLEAFMRRCVRLNFYRQDDSTVDQLVADLDDD